MAGCKDCERCQATLTWWSHSVVWGIPKESESWPKDYGAVCHACRDGFCSEHALSGFCPRCGRRL